jgi:hypothetical protein
MNPTALSPPTALRKPNYAVCNSKMQGAFSIFVMHVKFLESTGVMQMKLANWTCAKYRLRKAGA